jgi:hypothetical protein
MIDDDGESHWPHPSCLVDIRVNQIRCGPADDDDWEMLFGTSDSRMLLRKTMTLQLAKVITDHYKKQSSKPFATLETGLSPTKRTARDEEKAAP